MAIVFVWGLAVQFCAQGIGGYFGRFGLNHGSGRMTSYLVAAALLAAIGEGLRRHREWARFATLAVAILVIVLGVLSCVVMLAGHGMPRRLILTTITELTLIPWIAWRLSLPRTARSFTSSAGGVIGAGLAGAVVYAAIVIDRVSVSGLRLSTPSGKPMALAASVTIELVGVPLIAALVWLSSVRTARARPAGSAPQARVYGIPWVAALVAWAVPWGVVVAITQGIGLK